MIKMKVFENEKSTVMKTDPSPFQQQKCNTARNTRGFIYLGLGEKNNHTNVCMTTEMHKDAA